MNALYTMLISDQSEWSIYQIFSIKRIYDCSYVTFSLFKGAQVYKKAAFNQSL